MGMLRRIAAAIAAGSTKSLGSTANPSDRLVQLFGGPLTSSGVQVSDTAAMRVGAVYACVRVIAEDLAKLPVRLWRRRPGGGRDEAADHPLHRILRRPNRHMTRVSLMMALGAAWGFRGNAIAVILRDERGRPSGLWPVHPGSVMLYEAEDGTLFYGISRRKTIENAMLAGVPLMVPDYDIVHVRGLTFDGIVGLSPLAQMREAVGIALAAERLTGSLMANGAQPAGVLKHDGQLSEPAAERLRASWNDRYAGPGNAGTTAILEEGMDYKSIGMTSVDLQFIEQRSLTVEDIAGGFRVPLFMIGRVAKAAGNNSQESAIRQYYAQTLMPIIEAFEAQFALSFDLPDDLFVEFDVKRLIRSDFKARQEGHRTMFQSGSLKPNEWRIEEGYNPVPAGDVFARPLNTAYVNDAGEVVYIAPAGGDDPVAEPGGASSNDGDEDAEEA